MENKIIFARMKDVVINSLETIILPIKVVIQTLIVITLMLVRGVGIRDISKIEEVSIGKAYTVAIEGNNCKLRNRIKRAFRKTCCFSKKQINHLKTLAFFYINYGYI